MCVWLAVVVVVLCSGGARWWCCALAVVVITRSHMNDYQSLTTPPTTARLPLPHEGGVRDVIVLKLRVCVTAHC